MKMFSTEKNPKTFAYVLENDTINRRCNMCGSVVLRNPKSEKPYQCMSCDCDLLEIETHIGADHSDEELNILCLDTEVLGLDYICKEHL